jgi:prevent-host-death family protein
MDVSLSELRTRLKEVMEEVKQGKSVLLTERGKPLAMIEPIKKVEPLGFADNIRETMAEIKANPILKIKADQVARTDLENMKRAQQRKDDILRGVNKKK